jgi:hypothetical protein
MLTQKNPWDVPGWHAIGREGALVRQLIGSGVTALGRASYANKTGEYYTAFFGLSVGFERLSKLILVVDHAISHQGLMPEETVVRRFGHKLLDLANAAEDAGQKYDLKLNYPRPKDLICQKIFECLDAFADAGRGRYANFAALGNPNLSDEEPVSKWWGEVAKLILREHYYGKQIQARVEGQARIVDSLMSPFTSVLHTAETGEMMSDVLSASVRTGQGKVVQNMDAITR